MFLLRHLNSSLTQLIATQIFDYSKTLSPTVSARCDRAVINITKDGYTPISICPILTNNTDTYNYITTIGDVGSGNMNRAVILVYGARTATNIEAHLQVLVTYIKNS